MKRKEIEAKIAVNEALIKDLSQSIDTLIKTQAGKNKDYFTPAIQALQHERWKLCLMNQKLREGLQKKKTKPKPLEFKQKSLGGSSIAYSRR